MRKVSAAKLAKIAEDGGQVRGKGNDVVTRGVSDISKAHSNLVKQNLAGMTAIKKELQAMSGSADTQSIDLKQISAMLARVEKNIAKIERPSYEFIPEWNRHGAITRIVARPIL